MCCHDVAS
ncbi:hypothetical protein ECEC1850_2955, partial [Escherichia coli EC1850]